MEAETEVLELGAFLYEQPVPRSQATLDALLQKAGLSGLQPEQKELLIATPSKQLVSEIMLKLNRSYINTQQLREGYRWFRVLRCIAKDKRGLAQLQSSVVIVQLLVDNARHLPRSIILQGLKQSRVHLYITLLVELACTVADGLKGYNHTALLQSIGCCLLAARRLESDADARWKTAVIQWKHSVALGEDWVPVMIAIARKAKVICEDDDPLMYMIKELLDSLALADRLTPDSIKQFLHSVIYSSSGAFRQCGITSLVLCNIIQNNSLPMEQLRAVLREMAGDKHAANVNSHLLSLALSRDDAQWLRATLLPILPQYAKWPLSARAVHRLIARQLSDAKVLADVQPLVGCVEQMMSMLVQRLQLPHHWNSDYDMIIDVLKQYASKVAGYQCLYESPVHQQALLSGLPAVLGACLDNNVRDCLAATCTAVVCMTKTLLKGGQAAELTQEVPGILKMMNMVDMTSVGKEELARQVQSICSDIPDGRYYLEPEVIAAFGEEIDRLSTKSSVFAILAEVVDEIAKMPSTGPLLLDPSDQYTWQVQEKLLQLITGVMKKYSTSSDKLTPLVQLMLACGREPFTPDITADEAQNSTARSAYMQTMKAWCKFAADLVGSINNRPQPQQQLLCRLVERLSMLAKDDPVVLQYTIQFGKAWDRLAELVLQDVGHLRLSAAMYGLQRAVAKVNEWPVHLAAQLAVVSIAGRAQPAAAAGNCRKAAKRCASKA